MTTPDGETDEFEIFAGVQQAPYLSIIPLDCGLKSAIEGREEDL